MVFHSLHLQKIWVLDAEATKIDRTFLQEHSGRKISVENSTRVSLLTRSFAQDIIYAVSCGKIKTPKCLLLHHLIETLTNNTELENLICKLGHGASYTVIEELDTENAYKMIVEQQQNYVILPDDVSEEVFTLFVTDKISCKEETLSDKNSSFFKGGCKLHLMTLLYSFLILLYWRK